MVILRGWCTVMLQLFRASYERTQYEVEKRTIFFVRYQGSFHNMESCLALTCILW